MRTAHLVRKYDLAEWGGTESAVQSLLHGLHQDGVESVLFCPRPRKMANAAPPPQNGCALKYFNAFVPVCGLTAEQKRQFVAVGGNLFSFDLLPALWGERDVQIIHSHTLGRLGAVAGAVARRRRVPFVVTIHGGFLDLPKALSDEFHKPESRGFDWGRLFGLLLRSRQMLEQADAILTCNPTEAARLRERFPGRRVQVHPHGITAGPYQTPARDAALEAWPELRGQQVLLCVGRIDPVKNQRWLLDQVREVWARHPRIVLVLVGPGTDEAYAESVRRQADALGAGQRVLFTGGLPPGDKRLTGLFQLADALILPSVSETFGLVLLEAWAAGTAVMSSRTSGAAALICHGENGWLFDLERPKTFHEAVDAALADPAVRRRMAANGNAMVMAQYDLPIIARRTLQLYQQLIEDKSCTT